MPAVKLLGEGGVTGFIRRAFARWSRICRSDSCCNCCPPPAEARTAAVEAGLAHKQKLDCALQLARTVSLDFNNALTSILGHTSLVLSKMEPDNPWRQFAGGGGEIRGEGGGNRQ